MQSSAKTVEEYINSLPEERREAISKIRKVILKNLPKGYKEGMQYGMIAYYIPLSRYPNTYNGQPLSYVALASQKNHMAVYLSNIYGDPELEAWFKKRYKASGKPMDIGKSCVRFRKLEHLPLDLIGEAVAKTTPEEYIKMYETSRK